MLIPATVVISANWRYLERDHIRLLFSSVAIGFLTTVFGLVHELRVFIPSLTILTLVATISLARPATAQPTPQSLPHNIPD